MSSFSIVVIALVALLASPRPTLKGVIAKDTSFDPNDCSLYCAAYPKLLVSHQLPPERSLAYGSSELADGNPATAWVVKGGVGEGFTFEFDAKYLHPVFPLDNQTTGVDQLYIWNGYNKTTAHWRDHARVRELELFVDGNPVALVELLDDPRPQAVDLPPTLLRAGMRFRFTIRKTYPGLRFDETAVSEARLDGYGHH